MTTDTAHPTSVPAAPPRVPGWPAELLTEIADWCGDNRLALVCRALHALLGERHVAGAYLPDHHPRLAARLAAPWVARARTVRGHLGPLALAQLGAAADRLVRLDLDCALETAHWGALVWPPALEHLGLHHAVVQHAAADALYAAAACRRLRSLAVRLDLLDGDVAAALGGPHFPPLAALALTCVRLPVAPPPDRVAAALAAHRGTLRTLRLEVLGNTSPMDADAVLGCVGAGLATLAGGPPVLRAVALCVQSHEPVAPASLARLGATLAALAPADALEVELGFPFYGDPLLDPAGYRAHYGALPAALVRGPGALPRVLRVVHGAEDFETGPPTPLPPADGAGAGPPPLRLECSTANLGLWTPADAARVAARLDHAVVCVPTATPPLEPLTRWLLPAAAGRCRAVELRVDGVPTPGDPRVAELWTHGLAPLLAPGAALETLVYDGPTPPAPGPDAAGAARLRTVRCYLESPESAPPGAAAAALAGLARAPGVTHWGVETAELLDGVDAAAAGRGVRHLCLGQNTPDLAWRRREEHRRRVLCGGGAAAAALETLRVRSAGYLCLTALQAARLMRAAVVPSARTLTALSLCVDQWDHPDAAVIHLAAGLRRCRALTALHCELGDVGETAAALFWGAVGACGPTLASLHVLMQRSRVPTAAVLAPDGPGGMAALADVTVLLYDTVPVGGLRPLGPALAALPALTALALAAQHVTAVDPAECAQLTHALSDLARRRGHLRHPSLRLGPVLTVTPLD